MKTATKLQIARGLSSSIIRVRKLLGKDAWLTTTRSGIRWKLDLREGIDLGVYLGTYERSTLKAYGRLVARGARVADIGANIGVHTLHLANLVGPGGQVFAIEPTRFAYDKLCANLSLNPALARRVRALHAILLDDAPRGLPSKIYSSWNLFASGDAHSLHGGHLRSTEGASVFTFDRLMQTQIGRIDLIKLDVDGYEPIVLRGMRQTLRTQRPPIVMELAPYTLRETGESLAAMTNVLSGASYTLEELETGRPLPIDPGALERLCHTGESRNVLARPAL